MAGLRASGRLTARFARAMWVWENPPRAYCRETLKSWNAIVVINDEQKDIPQLTPNNERHADASEYITCEARNPQPSVPPSKWQIMDQRMPQLVTPLVEAEFPHPRWTSQCKDGCSNSQQN